MLSDPVLSWCAGVLGPFELLSDASRAHAGERAGAFRISAGGRRLFVKVHRDGAHWHSETHAYERWSKVFGQRAPELIAVRESEPKALILSELEGRPLEDMKLPLKQERAAWHDAGEALARLHSLDAGDFFGSCLRDGSSAGEPEGDAVAYIRAQFDDLEARGLRGGWLRPAEEKALRLASELLPSFAGEAPVPCHHDYCPANWIIAPDGSWAGVIDFEFSAWDARAADFARYPDWTWISRPDLLEAFFDGYGLDLSPRLDAQIQCSRALYALEALVWGMENEYFTFAQEGRDALEYLFGALK